MIPVLVKTFQEPLESTGLITVLRVFYQVEFRAFLAVLFSFDGVVREGIEEYHIMYSASGPTPRRTVA